MSGGDRKGPSQEPARTRPRGCVAVGDPSPCGTVQWNKPQEKLGLDPREMRLDCRPTELQEIINCGALILPQDTFIDFRESGRERERERNIM